MSAARSAATRSAIFCWCAGSIVVNAALEKKPSRERSNADSTTRAFALIGMPSNWKRSEMFATPPRLNPHAAGADVDDAAVFPVRPVTECERRRQIDGDARELASAWRDGVFRLLRDRSR